MTVQQISTTQVVIDDLERISKAKGKLKKSDTLKSISTQTKRMFTISYDPFLNFGITKIESTELIPPSDETISTDKIFDILSEGRGRDLRDRYAGILTEKQLKIVNGIFNGFQDFKLGISGATFLKAFPGSFETFSVQLASGFDANKFIPGSFSQPKYDGVRCIITVDESGNVSCLSRNGKPINNLDPEIIDYLSKYRGFMFDGEVLAKDDEENFSKSVGIVHRKSSSETLTVKLFDVMTLDEFRKRKCETPYNIRYTSLITTIDNRYVAMHKRVDTVDEVYEMYRQHREAGLEGSIIKSPNGFYSFKRTTDWMKLKGEITVDARIVGYQEGRGRLKDRLGAFIVEFEEGGPRTSVGGGYSVDQRAVFWGRRNEMINDIIEIMGQEITKDGRIRHPRFIKHRTDKNETSIH